MQRSSLFRYAAALLLLAAAPLARAQTSGVGIGTTTPDAAAALDISATDKGLLIPRLDSAQRTGIATPPDGLMVFQTDGRKGFWYAMNGGWLFIPDKARANDNLGNHTATRNLNLAGNQLVGNGTSGLAIDNLGNVGIGTTTPGQKLEVNGSTTVTGNVGIGTTAPTQRLDVRGNLRLGDDGGSVGGTGQAIEWVGPGVSSDPVGIYRLNPNPDQSQLRVVVGDVPDANDKFVVGRMGGTSSEGGIPGGNFTPNFSVNGAGAVNINSLAGSGTRLVTTDADGTLGQLAIPADNDAQTLSLAGSTLSISGGNAVTLPTGSTGDNLGNHTATQNINLSGNKLVGGTTARAIRGGLKLDGNGLLTLGAPRVHPDSTNRYGVRLTDIDQDFIVTSDQGKGQMNPISVAGPGDRLMWLSYFSAFRAGGVTGDRWNYQTSSSTGIGMYSAAFGLDNQAGSPYTTAFGWNNRLRNAEGSLATGITNSGTQAFYGVLMGGINAMSGWYGLVGGYQSKVRGSTLSSYSSSLGVYVPNWPPSMAFGQGCYARSSRGNNYTLGYYARSQGYYGSFVLADMSPLLNLDPAGTMPADRQQDSVYSTTYNQMTMRFAGGYRLFTTVATRTDPAGLTPLGTPVGVQLFPGGNSWQTLSDSTKKERRVLADGNAFLERIGRLRLGSWNYKGQSPDTMRHYGPMAQDFYAAFGHDGVGRSGNATTINQADFDGVNLIAIQALYRRLQTLEAENARQQQQIVQLLAQARATPAPATPSAATAEALAALEARLRLLEARGEQARK